MAVVTDLAACAHCGDISPDVVEYDDGPLPVQWRVECVCGACTPWIAPREDAISHWNTMQLLLSHDDAIVTAGAS